MNALAETQLQEEISAAITEGVKNSREEGLKMYWHVGEILRRYEHNGTNITEAVRTLKGMSETSYWFAIKLYDTYGDFESLYGTEDGQNTSVEKQKKLLGFRKEKKDGCRNCPLHCQTMKNA